MEEISHLTAEGDKGTRERREGESMRPCASKAGASGKHKGVYFLEVLGQLITLAIWNPPTYFSSRLSQTEHTY